MRCAQLFIPIASGRLEKQILELRCFGLADFSKHIADKYSGAELGKFKFPTLTLLQRVSSLLNVFNTTQIFPNQVISPPPSTTKRNLNLNILIFLNTVVQRFVEVKSKPQNLHSTRFTFSNNSTISITRTSSQLDPRVYIGGKSQISQSGGWTFSQSSTILISKTSLPQLNQLENMEVRQKQQTSQAVLSFQNKSDAFAVESPSSFSLQQSENNTRPTQNLQLEESASPAQIFIWRSPSPTLLTENQKPLLVHLPNMNQITSTVEGTSQFIQRLQSIETQTILQFRKVATNSSLFYNALTPSITRGNIAASLISHSANINYQTQQNTSLFNNILMQKVASRESKSQIYQLGEWTFSQSSTILISKTSLPQLNQLENMGMRQKQQTSQAVLLFQNKSNAFAVESSGSFSLQQSESNTLPTQNLQLEKSASPAQILVSRSPSPTLLTENQKPLLIHLANTNQITSTVKGTSQFIQRLQSIETQTSLQYKKVATNSTNSEDNLSLAPHYIRTRRLSKYLQSSENLLHQQVDNNTNKNQLKLNSSPNTLTMEFVQPKANIFPVPNNQENQLENHQDKKVKVKNDLIKQMQTDTPTINVNHIAEQVYQLIEKKIKIERQRRGML
ncbi:hypothetical protein [Dendronalium sp. ChiSLP03b]|uniref:hypothetical protein n=1 Tax=Dendronalium sp. ChiSLP03b TaxID=3075381 RepID=UPI002AD3A87A|nr:hypothetical protein [Dendronalium sp. ChiSLP03b]MDZ8208919.1 hypothetical protein [Dendronalium sp. ChiSLP03b]